MAISTHNSSFDRDPNWKPAGEAEKILFGVTDWYNTYRQPQNICIEGLKMTYTILRGDTARRYHTEKTNQKYYFKGEKISFLEARGKFDQAWNYLRENNLWGAGHKFYFDENLFFIKAE